MMVVCTTRKERLRQGQSREGGTRGRWRTALIPRALVYSVGSTILRGHKDRNGTKKVDCFEVWKGRGGSSEKNSRSIRREPSSTEIRVDGGQKWVEKGGAGPSQGGKDEGG